MKKNHIEPFFATLKAANPQPNTELEYTSVFELLALNKPSVLMPLTSASTRGDQLLNANYFEKKGYAKVVDQNTATPESLVAAIDEVYAKRAEYAHRMCEDTRSDGTDAILKIIKEAVQNG